mgnify:CR=1 FL=1
MRTGHAPFGSSVKIDSRRATCLTCGCTSGRLSALAKTSQWKCKREYNGNAIVDIRERSGILIEALGNCLRSWVARVLMPVRLSVTVIQ